jgi:peptidoglycan/LPS O-acetylase OafA/YrhL
MTTQEQQSGGVPLGRVPELDLLRFIASASVVLYHFTYRPRFHGVIDEQAFGLLPAVTRFGYLGVTLFFMISGFVILWSSQARSAGEFVVSRIARLYPSFWICVILTTIVVNATHGGGGDPISLRTLLINLTMVPGALGAPYVDGVYWTLFVELKFYVLVFLVLISRTMVHVEIWLAVWLAASIASAIGIAPKAITSLALYPYGPYFISGCLFYLIRARGASAFRLSALVATCWLGAQYAIAQQPAFMAESSRASGIVVAASVVAFHLLFAAIAFRPRILPASTLWYWLGGLTYPLYLVHNRIGDAIATLLPGGPWTILFVELTVAMAISIVLAAIVERRLGGTFHKWLLQHAVRFRVVRQPRPRSAPAASA